MKYAMLIDQTRCIGCGACTVNCKGRYEEASFGVLRTRMNEYQTGTFPNVKMAYRKHACMHCFDPKCVEVCPKQAISKVEGENGGMVVIDVEECIGCGMCVSACPFGAPEMDGERRKSEKCTFCHKQVLKGKATYCADACPVGAISFGERDDLLAQADSRVSALKAKGRSKAAVYGKDDTGVLLVIDGDATDFNLPKEGWTVSSLGWKTLASPFSGAMVAAALGGAGLSALRTRIREVEEEDNK